MSTYEYWIGQDVNFVRLWEDFDAGLGYVDKYQTMRVHLIRFTFAQYPSSLPLFNHEAIFKTIKGYFHELKFYCLRPDDYNTAGPLFLYEISRSSAVWSFLGELRQLLLMGTTLAEEIAMGQQIDNVDKKLRILREHFDNSEDVRADDFRRFMSARTRGDLDFAVQRLLEQGLLKVELSAQPFLGSVSKIQDSLVDLKALLAEDEQEGFLTKLRKVLAARFSIEDLRTLCFDLGVDYDELPGETKQGKARELVRYLQQHNCIHKLIRVGRRLRPDIPWEDVAQ